MVFQMPPLTQKELDDFLAKEPIATLCTQNEDGSIHATPLWFKYEGGQISFGTQEDQKKIKNIKSNPNVTVLVDNHDRAPYRGVMIYGRANLDYDDVIAKRVALFEKYLPKKNAEGLAQGLAKLRKPIIIRVTPNKIISYDYAKDSTGLFS